VDGDGAADLDTGKTGYAAMSLGGIMGIELAARYDRFQVMPLFVTGAPMGVVVRDSLGFSSLLVAVRAGATDGEVVRLILSAQALLDAGDPAPYAPLLLSRRAAGTGPHVLLGLAHDDDTIPNSSTYGLARALGLARFGAVRGPQPLLPDATAPLSGNGPGGRTAGMFEYDRVTFQEGGTPRAAEHSSTGDSREGQLQRRRFLEDWLAGRTPVIVDPYAELGTPPL
jgi:hypothetical protein